MIPGRLIRLSERLRTIGEMVEYSDIICDMGCDHGHLSVFLIQSGRAGKVIATDIGEGPLQRCRETVEEYSLADVIELRLSDGAAAIAPGEAGGCVIAGMGGMLMERIIHSGARVFEVMDELVLSPHSDACDLRRFLSAGGYEIQAEKMVREDGKFYPVMRVRHTPGDRPMPDALDLRYGPCLMRDKDPVLYEYLEVEREKLCAALEAVENRSGGERGRQRAFELKEELSLNSKAYQYSAV